MLTLVFLFVFLIPYLTVGARYSRNRYAELQHVNAQKQMGVPSLAELKAMKVELNSLRSGPDILGDYKLAHEANCRAWSWISEVYRNTHCNCGVKKKVGLLEQNIRAAEAGKAMTQEPSVFTPLLFWPGYMATSYLKGGKVDKPNYALIEELEKKELGL